jgi:tRNA wybutosine-synthesizing protein 1
MRPEIIREKIDHSRAPNNMVDPRLASLLKRQKYQLVGNHSAVKKCRWLHKSLVEGKACYKARFYGINSHRCLQMTPSAVWCTQRCLYCWRIQDREANSSWNESITSVWDDPAKIVNLSMKAQRNILSGYKGQVLSGNIRSGIYTEALEPKHAAISLTGEPTIYPHIDGLLSKFHSSGLTTFLVTNGTRPEILSNLAQEPTQLYISLSAPNFEKYQAVCRPVSPKSWVRLLESLELIKSFSCPTAIRITLAKGLNLEDHVGYAKLISQAEPTYIEPKSYMYVGYSRQRLEFLNMPTHREIYEFSSRLAESTGYRIIDESAQSRVVLLSRLEKPIKVSSD